jgi:hypothetical protein
MAADRADINSYANDLLLEFVDAFHTVVKRDLEEQYGARWLEEGVHRHLDPKAFERAKQMLDSPMRVVDMGKTDEELYGVEHLANIVDGNWTSVFKEKLGDRSRVKVYLSEIAEVRHNVSHRRRRHVLRRAEVIRLAQNCNMLLRGVGSEEAPRFANVVDLLGSQANPWGSSLGGYLPPSDEIVEDFVGRPTQLDDLSIWLASDMPQLLVWGYGGAGKSALAFEFAREMREAAPAGINGVCWVSAKRTEYVGGAARPKRADFVDRTTLVPAIFSAIYESDMSADSLSESDLLAHLRDLPILLVVDDFDTVLEDESLVDFLMHDVRATGSRVLYTSRQKVYGIKSVEVLGFEGRELKDFIALRAFEHELDTEPCVQRADAIRSVTDGFPLFIDDLLRYARLDGIKAAIEDWSQRKGDGARAYALRRQLEQLGDTTREGLIALSVADRPLTTLELGTLAGVTDDDAVHAVENLLRWRLVNRVASGDEDRPAFGMNLNTKRLVGKTYGSDEQVGKYQARFRALGSGRTSVARNAATAMAIGLARSLVIRGDVDGAITALNDRMVGELADSPELLGALGWTYSRLPEAHAQAARKTFERAYEMGNTIEDTYVHWSDLEIRMTEARVNRIPDSDLVRGWQEAARVAELGMKVVGATKALCQIAGYARSREGKTLDRLGEFSDAQRAYADSVAHLRKGLSAPASTTRDVSREDLYRGLAIAYKALGDEEQLAEIRPAWEAVGPYSAARFFETSGAPASGR